jgi:hypothetical protein
MQEFEPIRLSSPMPRALPGYRHRPSERSAISLMKVILVKMRWRLFDQLAVRAVNISGA